MSYPFFQCTSCSANVQLQWVLKTRFYLPLMSHSNTFNPSIPAVMVTSELDSEDFANNCRGQGNRYAVKVSDKKVQMSPGEWISPDSHFNFTGMFEGKCCFCALRMGFYFSSDVVCYHCQRREMLLREFVMITASHKGVAGSEKKAPTWETHGWGALSDALVDYILALALNNRYSGDGNMDGMLLDC